MQKGNNTSILLIRKGSFDLNKLENIKAKIEELKIAK
jgi:uncharacterized membrane protein YcaP (DUF421 family)